ncbi:MAG: hypothetical protein FWE63_06485 [Bacteroidales bacterium]|nr:hypothetical protein [Bacteroidales bacterium]
MENPFNTEQTKPKRSTLLSVFLVLTFIGSGLNFIGNGYIALSFENVISQIEELADDEAMASMATLLERYVKMMEKAGNGYYGLLALLALASIVGAALMWRLNKLGFHFYASAQIIMLFLPMAFGLIKFPDVFGTIITAIFIFVYARELKIFASKTHNE